MAVKYNLPSPGTRPLFFRLPGGRGGVPRAALPYLHRPAARRPSSLMVMLSMPVVRNWWTSARIIRIVIENPTNRQISKQSVIYLVRIISIERTSALFCPFGLKILRRQPASQELFSIHRLMFAYANRKSLSLARACKLYGNCIIKAYIIHSTYTP